MIRMGEIDFSGAVPIDGYGPGFFRIGGQVFEGPTLILPGTAPVAWAPGDTGPILAVAAQIDVVFFGTGAEIAPIARVVRDALEGAGIGAEQMATPAACRTFNVLLAEGRRIGAALLPV